MPRTPAPHAPPLATHTLSHTHTTLHPHSPRNEKPLSSVPAPAIKEEKKDVSTAILERKKAPNRLIVDDATNDDNSVVALR
jgi:hypothetical protein